MKDELTIQNEEQFEEHFHDFVDEMEEIARMVASHPNYAIRLSYKTGPVYQQMETDE